MVEKIDDIKHSEHSLRYGLYISVWLGLVALTIVTVALSGMNFSSLTVPIALAVAVTKSVMVAGYFMHIKFDSKVFKLFITICILIFLTMIILTFFDLTFRTSIK
jgi:cytochrome c oxidase subunit IV